MVNCYPNTAVGQHSCGDYNGWILLHDGYTFNASGAHPLNVGTGLHYMWFK